MKFPSCQGDPAGQNSLPSLFFLLIFYRIMLVFWESFCLLSADTLPHWIPPFLELLIEAPKFTAFCSLVSECQWHRQGAAALGFGRAALSSCQYNQNPN